MTDLTAFLTLAYFKTPPWMVILLPGLVCAILLLETLFVCLDRHHSRNEVHLCLAHGPGNRWVKSKMRSDTVEACTDIISWLNICVCQPRVAGYAEWRSLNSLSAPLSACADTATDAISEIRR